MIRVASILGAIYYLESWASNLGSHRVTVTKISIEECQHCTLVDAGAIYVEVIEEGKKGRYHTKQLWVLSPGPIRIYRRQLDSLPR